MVNDIGAEGIVLFGQRKTFLFTDRLGNSKLYDAFAYDCGGGSIFFIPMLVV